MENQNNNTVIVYTYRYIWKEKNNRLCVKFITGPQEEHALFQKSIVENDNIVSCMREYVSEVNFVYLGFTEEVKKENVEEKVEEKDTKD